MAPSLSEVISVRPTDEKDVFMGVSKAAKMGNTAPLAFGGCVMSQCISAGFASLPPETSGPHYELYSVSGAFLGPTSTEVLIRFTVEHIRDTKSFATRKVDAWQDVPSKQDKTKLERRRVMTMLLDFQVRESHSAYEFARLPVHADTRAIAKSTKGEKQDPSAFREAIRGFYGSPDTNPSLEQYWKDTDVPQQLIRRYLNMFPLFLPYYDLRAVPNSMAAQKMFGINRHAKTSQDEELLSKRNSAMWFKTKDASALSQRGLTEASMAFYMDGALAFITLTLTHQFLASVAAVSSLEFSLRFLHPPQAGQWMLQEQVVESGNSGRTFGIGRVWDTDGRLVAHMSQVAIMRPYPDEKTKAMAEGKAEKMWAKL